MLFRTNLRFTFFAVIGCFLGFGMGFTILQAAPTTRRAKPAVQPATARTKAPARPQAPAPAPRPETRTAPAAQPVPRPAARTEPAPRPTPRPAPRPAAQPDKRPVAPVVRRAEPPPRPAVRTEPAPRPATRRPAPAQRPAVARRTAPRPAPTAPQLVSTVTRHYTMHFRQELVGNFSRTEKKFSDGTYEVKNVSKMNIKMLFTTVQATNTSTCWYDKDNRLMKFDITSEVRGKTTAYNGKRSASGMSISKKQDGKTVTQFFPKGSFQGTSLDFRFPSAPPGVKILRHYLVIPRMDIVEQLLIFRKAPSRKVFGRQQPTLEISIRNQRGRGTVLVTRDGTMIASRMHGRLGIVEIRLKE